MMSALARRVFPMMLVAGLAAPALAADPGNCSGRMPQRNHRVLAAAD